VLVTRKAELTRVVGTLVDLCYVNPKGVVGPFGVSLVSAKAVVKKAIMAFMPKCQTTSAGFEVPYQSSETTPQKMPQLTCILSIPVIIHIFLKKDNYFQILFIMNLSNKLSQNKLFLMMEWCVYFFIFTAIFHCLELDIKENQIDSSKKYTNQRL
jgi:hypothetical protein